MTGQPPLQNRLLIIDDEQTFGEFIGIVAKAVGYDVIVTDSSTEFWEQLENWQPTVILVDLLMPGVDGVEVLRGLAQKKVSAHVLVASGVDSRTLESVRQMGVLSGLRVAGVLPKPVRVKEARAIFTKLLNKNHAISAAELAAAIEHEQLFLLYQPKVQISNRRLIGVEALVRWRHPILGIISPDVFVPLAENEGLIDGLTELVLRLAIAQGGQWHQNGLPAQLSVNVSSANLHDLKLPDRICALCREQSFPADALTLELTETATMREPVQLMDVATRFRIKGFKLSIDDFGTGYSSLAQLQRLPFSEIKIDKSFTMEMGRSREAATLVEIIIEIGRRLSMKVVAEGVESEVEFESLAEYGCDIAQGYHISKPVEAARIPELAAKWRGVLIPLAETAIAHEAGPESRARRV